MCGLIVPPYLIAKAIEEGLRGGDRAALVWWCGALVVVAALLALLGMARHRTMTLVRTDASLRTAQLVVRHVTRLGGVVRVPAGERLRAIRVKWRPLTPL
mgnify:CR=1 FL=1